MFNLFNQWLSQRLRQWRGLPAIKYLQRHRWIGGAISVILLGSVLLTWQNLTLFTPLLAQNPQPSPTQTSAGQHLPIEARAWLGNQWIYLEVAKTHSQQALGLMYRDCLSTDRGMLFPFDPPQPVSFWMKNVRLNLDMLFVRNGTIVEIAHNTPPCQTLPCPTYGTAEPIDQVIELLGGTAQSLGVAIGDVVTIEPINTNAPTQASSNDQ